MNKFNVKTPDAWKENLFENLEHPKKMINYKAVIAIAAAVAILITSTTGFAYSQAPEYIGSRFFGFSKENLQEIYSPKNEVFKSLSDELTLTCEGIAGDKKSLIAIFELKSNGDFSFNPDISYSIDEWNVELYPIELNGWSIGSSSFYVDEKTVKFDVHFRSITNSIIGRTLHLKMKDIVCFIGDESEKLACEFEGKIKIDYPNTVVRLKNTKTVAQTDGICLRAQKAWISNLGFEYDLKITQGAELYKEKNDELEIPFDRLIITYNDGETDEFYIRLPKMTDKDIIISSVLRDGNTVRLSGKFPQLINSSKVVSVAFDDYVMFEK